MNDRAQRSFVPFWRVGLLPALISFVCLAIGTFILISIVSVRSVTLEWFFFLGLPAFALLVSLRNRAWFEGDLFVVRGFFRKRRLDLKVWSLDAEPYAGAWTQYIEANWFGIYQVGAFSARAGRVISFSATMTTRRSAEWIVSTSLERVPLDENEPLVVASPRSKCAHG